MGSIFAFQHFKVDENIVNLFLPCGKRNCISDIFKAIKKAIIAYDICTAFFRKKRDFWSKECNERMNWKMFECMISMKKKCYCWKNIEAVYAPKRERSRNKKQQARRFAGGEEIKGRQERDKIVLNLFLSVTYFSWKGHLKSLVSQKTTALYLRMKTNVLDVAKILIKAKGNIKCIDCASWAYKSCTNHENRCCYCEIKIFERKTKNIKS